MVKHSSHIVLNTIFEKQINSRSGVDLIFSMKATQQALEEFRVVYFDMTGIEFISRASAHQLLLTIRELTENEVVFLNLSGDVSAMLSAVSSSLEQKVKSRPLLKNLVFSSSREVDEYLLSI